eukprot:15177-Hanusia_phi.AAC.1
MAGGHRSSAGGGGDADSKLLMVLSPDSHDDACGPDHVSSLPPPPPITTAISTSSMPPILPAALYSQTHSSPRSSSSDSSDCGTSVTMFSTCPPLPYLRFTLLSRVLSRNLRHLFVQCLHDQVSLLPVYLVISSSSCSSTSTSLSTRVFLLSSCLSLSRFMLPHLKFSFIVSIASHVSRSTGSRP